MPSLPKIRAVGTAERNAWLEQLYASLPQPQGNNNG